ncbi:MAG: S8 family peptidase [Patescibacteria group bacterium]|nr:S8 family peptidase [Patescibacteria group bacterium]
MKTKLLVCVLTITSLVFGLTGVSVLATQAAGNPHRVIVTLTSPVNEAARTALGNHGEILKELPLGNGLVVLLPSQAAVSAVGTLAGVKRVETDARVFALAPPGACTPWPACKDGGDEEPPEEPSQELPWGVDRVDADLTWSASRGFGVNVAVIDTGIDNNHPDLVGNLQGGVNFVSKNPRKPADSNKWDDDNGHGTHVAGIIAAVDNSEGVVGVAPEANLWAVKVLDRNGSGYISDVIAGINWAIANEMDVINMSLGSSSDVLSLHEAVDVAYTAGVVVVAATGNSGDGNGSTNEVNYPAKYDSVIAVGAIASDDSTPSWSSEGAEVELAAPGVDIKSTWKDGGYNTISGTSMASPHVAGTVALLLATADLAPAEVRANLQAAADDLGAVGHDNFYGYGLVDAEESITGVQTE